MKVVRNGVGWDIAFDMIFTDKQTAAIIARRIAPLLPTLIRDAVDASMLDQAPPRIETAKGFPNALALIKERCTREWLPIADSNAPREAAPSTYPAASIVSRVQAMGISVSSAAE